MSPTPPHLGGGRAVKHPQAGSGSHSATDGSYRENVTSYTLVSQVFWYKALQPSAASLVLSQSSSGSPWEAS